MSDWTDTLCPYPSGMRGKHEPCIGPACAKFIAVKKVNLQGDTYMAEGCNEKFLHEIQLENAKHLVTLTDALNLQRTEQQAVAAGILAAAQAAGQGIPAILPEAPAAIGKREPTPPTLSNSVR